MKTYKFIVIFILFFLFTLSCNDESELPINTYSFTEGQKLIIEAEPNSGFVFSHWTENGVRIDGDSILNYTIPSYNVKLVAHFIKQ